MSSTTQARDATLRVLLVEDDRLVATLVAEGLRALGHHVRVVDDPMAAAPVLEEYDPHALVSDLNFPGGRSGARLIHEARESRPWLAVVVFSGHRSPELAVDDAELLPDDIVYLVKAEIRAVAQIEQALKAALKGQALPLSRDAGDTPVVSASQAEMLRLLAAGYSTRALAEHRGTSVRAAESMLVRLYRALGIEGGAESNPRVEAVRIWQTGGVTVRAPRRG